MADPATKPWETKRNTVAPCWEQRLRHLETPKHPGSQPSRIESGTHQNAWIFKPKMLRRVCLFGGGTPVLVGFKGKPKIHVGLPFLKKRHTYGNLTTAQRNPRVSSLAVEPSAESLPFCGFKSKNHLDFNHKKCKVRRSVTSSQNHEKRSSEGNPTRLHPALRPAVSPQLLEHLGVEHADLRLPLQKEALDVAEVVPRMLICCSQLDSHGSFVLLVVSSGPQGILEM